MSTNKTNFLGLNDWIGTDPFKRDEINANFRALDAKAKEHEDTIGSLSKDANEYEWTSAAGQLTYVLPAGQSYNTASKWFEATVGGAPVPLSQIQMDSSTQFTLLVDAASIPEGVTVVARWTEPSIPATAGHHTKHELGGADEIDITKLKNFNEQVVAPLADKATQLAQNALYGKSYGMVMDGTSDDTVAFRNAIADAKSQRKKLIITGKIRITDEILIDEAIEIIGTGLEQGNGGNSSKSFCQIIFDNNQVDGSGNATKCALRFKKVQSYALNNVKIRNISINHAQQVKNQHSIILDNADFSYTNLDNLSFYNCSGYAIAFKGGYHQNLNWKNFSFYNVGGCIGRIDSSVALIATLGQFENFNLDQTINPTSPQAYMYDFAGIRHLGIDTLLAEAGIPNGATMSVLRLGGDEIKPTGNIVNNFWSEFHSATLPLYSVEIVGSGMYEFNQVSGINSSSKVKISGNSVLLKIKNLSAYNEDVKNLFDYTGYSPKIIIDGLQMKFLSISNPNTTGIVEVKNIVTNNGNETLVSNLEEESSLYEYTGGFLKDNRYVVFDKVGWHLDSISVVNDANEGRVLKLYSATFEANLGINITLPDEYVGSTVAIGLRYKCVSSAASNNTLYTTQTKRNILNNNIKDSWTNGYIIIKEAPKTFRVSTYGYSGQTSLYISDLKINFGGKIPLLKSKMNQTIPIKTQATTLVTIGDYLKGDVIENTNPTPSGYMGWICTTAGTVNNIAWVASTAYTVGQQVNTGGKVYQCTTAGTSGSSAPTGTGTGIADGTVTWDYVNTLAVFKGYGLIQA